MFSRLNTNGCWGIRAMTVPEGRARELAEWARQWYAKNGQPWVYARQADELKITNGSITIDGVSFNSSRLRKTLLEAQAHSAILVAVSAGPEVVSEAQRLWLEEKPDEYFFLEIFGSAVVEHLTTMTGARLCAWAETRDMSVLPHYSPGYPEWDISEQPRLLELMKRAATWPKCGMDVLDSGMLRPKKSLLAVFGLTNHNERVRRITGSDSVRELLVYLVPISPGSVQQGSGEFQFHRFAGAAGAAGGTGAGSRDAG